MSTLSVSNSFVASTTILSAQVNANFSAIVAWANGNIGSDNIGTLTGALAWTVASNALCLSGSNSGNQGVASFSQTGVLDASRSILKLTSSAAQTTGDAGIDVQFTNASSTIPVLRLTNDGSGNFITARTSAGATKFSVSSAGNVTAAGTLDLTGAATVASVTLGSGGPTVTNSAGTIVLTGAVRTSSTVQVGGGSGPTLSASGSALAVTGGITKASLPTVTAQHSTGFASYSFTASEADLTNMSVGSVVATGTRPVRVCIEPQDTASSYFQIGFGRTVFLKIYRDSTVIKAVNLSAGGLSAGNIQFPTELSFDDFPSAGTYTYKVAGWENNGSPTSIAVEMRLKIFEY
jgi:hypothetical protein